MAETTLYCNISNSPTFTIPPISEQDKAVTTISTFRTTINSYAEALILRAGEEGANVEFLKC